MFELYQNSLGTKIAALLLGIALLLVGALSGDFLKVADTEIALEELPYEFAGWKGQDSAGLDDKSKLILQLDKYAKRVYQNENGDIVYLYIGYWKKQNGEHQAAKHSPVLCLPSNGWQLGKRELTNMSLGNLKIPFKKVYADLKDKKYLFHYYFFAGKKFYAQEWKALLNISLQTMSGSRSDGGIVEAYTQIRSSSGNKIENEKSDKILTKFLNDLTPYLVDKINNPAKSPS